VLPGKIGGVALEHEHLPGVGEGHTGGREGGLERAPLDAPVAAVNGTKRGGKTPRGAAGRSSGPGWAGCP
jgi:hypothetical protein